MCNIRNGSYYKIIDLQQSLVYQICLRPFKTTHSNHFLVLVHVILVTAWENVACNIRNGCNIRNTIFENSYSMLNGIVNWPEDITVTLFRAHSVILQQNHDFETKCNKESSCNFFQNFYPRIYFCIQKLALYTQYKTNPNLFLTN